MTTKVAWIFLATLGGMFTCTVVIAAIAPATTKDAGSVFPTHRPEFVPSPTPVPVATQAPTATSIPPTSTPVRAPTPRPTPTKVTNRQPTSSELERWQEQIAVITLWFTLNVEATQACVLLGNIDWDNYGHRIERLAGEIEAIGFDAGDGRLDRFTVAQVERTLAESTTVMREIDRKCGF